MFSAVIITLNGRHCVSISSFRSAQIKIKLWVPSESIHMLLLGPVIKNHIITNYSHADDTQLDFTLDDVQLGLSCHKLIRCMDDSS